MKKILIIILLFKLDFAFAKDNLPEPKTWNNDLKELIYGDDEILDGSHLFALDTPYRALDAAIVPITINFKQDQEIEKHVKSLILIVD